MIRLLLRAQDIGWSTVGFIDGKNPPVFFRLDTRPESILNAVVNFLAEQAIPWDNIGSIAVVDGPGSFTALRSALTIVNTMAFTRTISLACAHAKPEEADAVVMQRLARARARQSFVVPHYGRPAHITKAKKR